MISDIDFYRLTTSGINTTDDWDAHFNQFITRVFRRPIHSRYPEICTRVSKLMLTSNPRPLLLLRRTGRKETVSTTLTRSVTNIKDQTSRTDLHLESFFLLFWQRTELIFWYDSNIWFFSDFFARKLENKKIKLKNKKIKGWKSEIISAQ